MSSETLKTYRGNCHCAAFVYEIDIPELKSYSVCNCSICTKKGYAWKFANQTEFRVVKGSVDDLKAYTFNTATFEHKFCAHCGIGLLASSATMPAGKNLIINIRTLQNVDLEKLQETAMDGKSFPPAFVPPAYTGPEPTADIEDAVIHHGSCHCGALTVALKTKPFENFSETAHEDRIIDCNCSFCSRAAAIWIYPEREQISIQGREHAGYYVFATGWLRKVFCSNCGVWIANELNPDFSQDVETMPKEMQDRARRFETMTPLTLRILDDYDVSTLKVRKLDGWNIIKPMYQNP